MSAVIRDAAERELVVAPGEVDGEPVALVCVRSMTDARTVVTLWLCPEQITQLWSSGWAAVREAREAVR